MDYSTMGQSGLFGNSTFASSATTQGTADKNKEKQFYGWHQKRGVSAPQDYPAYASQPAPFSVVQQNPNPPTAASLYLEKFATQRAISSLNGNSENDSFGMDMPDGRRKPTLKRNTSNSPPNSPAGTWPRSMFGTRPRSRTRARTASQADAGADNATSEDNAPPLASIYDTIVSDTTSNDTKASSDFTMTPTPVRVANFSDERFSDLVCALRRYYGPILEAYSGLPENESKFPDPEIIPRDQLDYATSKMVQPMSGKDGGPGPWVRITFRDREAAQRALEGSSKGELVVGGRTIIISPWVEDHTAVSDAGLPFSTTMDIDPPALRRRSSANPTPSLGGGSVFGEPTPSGNPAVDGNGVALSDHMPGARRVIPKRVEFAKKEGWISRWLNALISAAPRGGSTTPAARQGWGNSIGSWYRYIMDEVVGFKYL